jgi:hypothetical protein
MNDENFENTSLQWEFEAQFELSCTHRGNPFYKLQFLHIILLGNETISFYQY